MSKEELVSIVVPIYNEKENIQTFLHTLLRNIKCKYEVLFVYDIKGDNTLPYIKKFCKSNRNVKLLQNSYGSGIPAAVKTGINKSKGNILVVMAADMTDDPRAIDLMHEKILEGYDIVCPTRYSKGGRKIGKASMKSFLSKVAGLTTPYILGIPTSDLTYSFKMFRKDILKKIHITSVGGWEFSEELLIKSYNEGYRITEVPCTWVDRREGKSKFKLLKWLPDYIYWYLWGVGKRIKVI